MPSELVDRYGKRIRVRISSKRASGNHETLIFDENRHNSFRTSGGGDERSLYATYVPEDSIQIDSTTNAVELDSVNTTATVNFVSRTDSSDFPDVALGYGLYCISIEYPYVSCTTPPLYFWKRETWIMDFFDSRFAASYGVGSAGEITFSIKLKHQDKECGAPYIDIDLTTPSRSVPLRLANYGFGADYHNDTPVPIHDVFEQSAPEFDFHISGSIYRGLDSTLKQDMSRTFELTHSAQIDTDIELEDFGTFTISNSFDAHYYTIERDSVLIKIPDTRHISTLGPSFSSFKITGNTGNPIMIRSASNTRPTGLVINAPISATIEHAEMELVQPITMWADSGAMSPGSLTLRNSRILRTQNDGDGVLVFLLRPYAIRVINSNCMIDSCVIAPVDSTVTRGSGILLKDVKAPSEINRCTIKNFPGHGIEIVDGPDMKWGMNPKTTLWLDSNAVRNNRMYGVHIRGSRANPYLSYGMITANGWFGENTQEMQSRKFDAVNIQSAAGILQNNTFDSSGAYGLHASNNADIYSKWNNIQSNGKNCFRWNYYNLGGSGNSRISLGEDSASGFNAFSSPRATWSDPFHATLRHPYCIGELRGNAWESPDLSTNPYPVSKVDSAKSFEKPEYGGSPILCTQYLSPGGARNDSIVNGIRIDAIRTAISSGDWQQARDLSMQLLESSNDAYSATFSTTTLFEALRELQDPVIPSFLSLCARDTSLYHSSIAANYCAIKAFSYAGEHDSSIAMTNLLAQRFLYSDHWRLANIMAALIQNDYLGNYYAAEDILLSVLARYPDDAQKIGAYY